MKSLRAKPFKFNGGENVSETITGFTGTVTGVARYITGCDQYLVTPKAQDGKAAEGSWYDENRLELGDAEQDVPVSDDCDSDDGPMEAAPIK